MEYDIDDSRGHHLKIGDYITGVFTKMKVVETIPKMRTILHIKVDGIWYSQDTMFIGFLNICKFINKNDLKEFKIRWDEYIEDFKSP